MPKNLVFADDLLYEEMLDDSSQYLRPEIEASDLLAPFLEDGTIAEVLGQLKSGKEGTVFCCRAGPRIDVPLLAAKIFRPRELRTFRKQSCYREGDVIRNARDARALKKKTHWGRQVEQTTWMVHEFEILRMLFRAGAPVPKPIRSGENVILMEYIGGETEAAPKLHEVRLEGSEAVRLYSRLMQCVELLLSSNAVHADLSTYNVLYWDGDIRLIDFPQTVDPRKNPNARSLLERDLRNVCVHFARYGIRAQPEQLAQRLWTRYLRAEL